MAKKRSLEIGLPKLDDLFSSQESREEDAHSKIREIPLELIDEFPNHPFKVRDDEDMMNLVQSVQENGILVPAILRQKDDGRYELIAGHRRKRACEIAGLDTLRAEVMDLDFDEATIFMVDSNLQRTTILPSEKAFSYKMRLEAMKRQGKRVDLTSDPLGPKLRSNQELAEATNESATQIKRYIRLTELIPELLDMVDEGKIALRPAVELSYLSVDEQYEVYENMMQEACAPSHAQTIRMRELSKEENLTPDAIADIITETKPNQKEKLTISSNKILDLLPKNLKAVEREDYIVK
ncbi:MAG: ParB/RepB/Spo0J family partition protein, partial [Firmicutes bacterium]|nr:ParB/RepB/Spo0J family partition protein [Bacillota bacterium]